MKLPARLLTALLTAVIATSAQAGSLVFSVGGSQPYLAGIALTDFALPAGRASLGIWWQRSPGLSVHLRNTTQFGPLGNVIIDADGSVATDGRYLLRLSARGSLGPVAVRLRGWAADSDDLPAVRPPDSNFGQPAPLRGRPALGVQAGASWRVSRALTVSVDPSLDLRAGSGTLLLPLQLQLPRIAGGPHELILNVTTLVPFGPAAPAVWSAAGAGLRIDRGRAAAWQLLLQLGGNADWFSPGLSFTVQDDLAGGTVQASLQLEPWRQEATQLDLQAAWNGTVHGLGVEIGFHMRAPAALLTAGVSVSVPLD